MDIQENYMEILKRLPTVFMDFTYKFLYNLSQIGDYDEDIKFYPISIITKITLSNRAYTDIQKDVIQLDKFVVGSVEIAEIDRIY